MKFNSISFSFRLVAVALLACLFFAAGAAPQDTAKSSRASVKKVFYGQASFYANKFNGRKTANGEIFDQKKMTCACNAVKLGTWLRITNVRNGKSVIVKVNDRLPQKSKRMIDLSYNAAKQLNFISAGLTKVEITVLDSLKK